MKNSHPSRASRVSLALSTSLLLVPTVIHAQTTFSAFFNNGTGSFGNKTTAQYNWPVAVGPSGIITGLNDAGVSGGTTNGAGVPVVTGSTAAGFLFHVPVAEVASEAVLFHRTGLDTSSSPQDAPQGSWFRTGTASLNGRTLGEITRLSVYTRPGSTETVMRFAIQTGGAWYASADSFTQEDLNNYELKTLNNPFAGNWIANIGAPGEGLDTELGDNAPPAPLDSASVITGYGWYADTHAQTGDAARVRIDSFEILSSVSGPVQAPTSIVVTPAAAVVPTSGSQQFSAVLRDQSTQPIVPQPASFSWSVSGGGSIDGNGLFFAGTTAGSFTVTASAEGIDGATGFTITPAVVSGSTVFSAYFNNGNGSGVDDDASIYNWLAAIGADGVLDGTLDNAADDAVVGVSQGVTTEGTNAGVPLISGESTKGGFIFVLPDEDTSGVSLLHTTHLISQNTLQDNPQPDWHRNGNASLNGLKLGEITTLSVYTRPATTATTMRFAILADGQWYVSTAPYTQEIVGVYELQTLDNLTAPNAWYSNVFTAGSSLDGDLTNNTAVSLGADALVTGYGWYADTDTQISTDSRVRIDSFQVTTVVFSGGSAYDTWAGGSFARPFPEGQRGPEVDFDNDGLSNQLEFVLGGDPTISQPGVVPAVLSASGNDLVITFKRSDASQLEPVAVKVQVSNDLVNWDPANDIVIGDESNAGPIGGTGASYTVDDSGTLDTIVVTIPKGATMKKFARVVATQ